MVPLAIIDRDLNIYRVDTRTVPTFDYPDAKAVVSYMQDVHAVPCTNISKFGTGIPLDPLFGSDSIFNPAN